METPLRTTSRPPAVRQSDVCDAMARSDNGRRPRFTKARPRTTPCRGGASSKAALPFLSVGRDFIDFDYHSIFRIVEDADLLCQESDKL